MAARASALRRCESRTRLRWRRASILTTSRRSASPGESGCGSGARAGGPSTMRSSGVTAPSGGGRFAVPANSCAISGCKLRCRRSGRSSMVPRILGPWRGRSVCVLKQEVRENRVRGHRAPAGTLRQVIAATRRRRRRAASRQPEVAHNHKRRGSQGVASNAGLGTRPREAAVGLPAARRLPPHGLASIVQGRGCVKSSCRQRDVVTPAENEWSPRIEGHRRPGPPHEPGSRIPGRRYSLGASMITPYGVLAEAVQRPLATFGLGT